MMGFGWIIVACIWPVCLAWMVESYYSHKRACKHKWETVSIFDLKEEERIVANKYILQCEHCGELDEFETELSQYEDL